MNINNKEKNIKKENQKNAYGDFGNVKLTDEEYQKIQKIFPNDYKKRIQTLDDYIQSKGKRYKDFVATLKNWARRDGYIFPDEKEPEKQELIFSDDDLTPEELNRYRRREMTKEELRKILEERGCTTWK